MSPIPQRIFIPTELLATSVLHPNLTLYYSYFHSPNSQMTERSLVTSHGAECKQNTSASLRRQGVCSAAYDLTCIANLTRSFGILAVSVWCFPCGEPFSFSIILASHLIFVIPALNMSAVGATCEATVPLDSEGACSNGGSRHRESKTMNIISVTSTARALSPGSTHAN